MDFLKTLLSYMSDVIHSLGYWGIGIGMLIESACIPLPSEVVLPLGGFMVAEGDLTMLGANLVVNLGSMIGSLIAYFVGYYGGRPFILNFGKYFFVSQKHFLYSEKTFNTYGAVAVFFGRLLPIVRTFISLPAGITKMNIAKFSIYSLIGMIPWNFTLIFLGYKFGKEYEYIVRPIFKRFEYVVIAAIIVIITGFLVKFLFNKKRDLAS